MKNYIYLITVALLCFLFLRLLDYLDVSYFNGIFIGFPIFYYLIIYLTIKYNFRKSLDFKPIPQEGYEKRLSKLERNYYKFYGFGFKKIDEFYWQIANDAVVYVYYHKESSTFLCDYHLGKNNYFDLVTSFENGYTLTTSNSQEAGLLPRDLESMLQIFSDINFKEVVNKHLQAKKFLIRNGYKTNYQQLENFRSWFLSEFHKSGEKIKTPLAPIYLLFWKITQHKKKYLKSLHEQDMDRILKTR